jgi:hypothetical protein
VSGWRYRFKARQVGREDVADREIVPRRSKALVRHHGRRAREGFMAFQFEYCANRIANQRVTVDDENASQALPLPRTLPRSPPDKRPQQPWLWTFDERGGLLKLAESAPHRTAGARTSDAARQSIHDDDGQCDDE